MTKRRKPMPQPDHPHGGPPGQANKPEHPPEDQTVVKPPPPEGGWAWIPPYGWGYFPGPDEATPKA